MEEGKVPENSLTSAAAFVEGGIQKACDDACSICLEDFCDNDPSTVTSCKHEFHLQCILEWCQRSSQCPMCWQTITLKDPSSQELLDAVEHERNIRMNPPSNTTVFHHLTLGDFELQHLPVSTGESELREQILQHLAAAAAMGRARHFSTRDGQRNRSCTQASGSSAAASQYETSSSNRSPTSASPYNHDRSVPSDLQSFSETLKSRLSALSTKYKESMTKTTGGWKERLFARGQLTATVSRTLDHLEIAEVGRTSTST